MKQITEIRKAFPNQQVIELNNGTGCNIHFDFATVTVWFKKQKYGNVNGWFKYNALGEFIADMDRYINPPQKVVHIEPQAVPRIYAEGTAEGKRQIAEMLAAIETKQTPNKMELKASGFQTAEQTLDWHVQDASDNFDANYRQDCIDAIEAYHMQFSRGLIEIPDEFKSKHSGIQKAIDHINRKIEYAEKNGLSATNIAMLKTLNSELIQYL